MQSLIECFGAKGQTSQAVFTWQTESAFWIRARRNRLLAQWVCDLTDEDNQAYLKLLLDADFARIGTSAREDFLMIKIRNDLMGFGIFLSAPQIAQVAAGFERDAVVERSLQSLTS